MYPSSIKSITQLFILLCIALCFNHCGVYFVPPTKIENATIGEVPRAAFEFDSLPRPEKAIVVGVYKFKDQTGQYKASEVGSNWSTAVPQGLTTILIKALEDSKWFEPIERENISNLLNERQIIRTTRQEYLDGDEVEKLPPLLFADILLEGGVISYDTNLMTGGMGARYFGIGGSTQYRQDRITVYLRAVSTNSGKVLKTIYTSKNILSQSMDASFFRYIDVDRILEAEVGVTNNEPIQMAVTEAINKAVYLLILEGIEDQLWAPVSSDTLKTEELLVEYQNDEIQNKDRIAGKGVQRSRRNQFAIGGAGTFNRLDGDYGSQTYQLGLQGSLKFKLSNNFNYNVVGSYLRLGDLNSFYSQFLALDNNLEYLMLPYNQLSPYVFGGFGVINDVNEGLSQSALKTQFGGGFEYLPSDKIGMRLFAAYHFSDSDVLDNNQNGSLTDHYLQFGFGLQFYFNTKR